MLTIAMPVYNEASSIATCVRRALSALDTAPGTGEVLVIDDGSTDSTPQILDSLLREDSRLRVHRNETNSGIGVFNRQMLALAKGDWVFFISSDGEFAFDDAVRFVEIAEGGSYDAVLGYRSNKHYSLYRLIVSWLFNWAVFLFFGARFRDIGSVRLLRRERFAAVPVYCQSAFINAERLLVAQRHGATIKEVPVRHYPRLSGKGSGAQPRKVLNAFGDLILTRLRWFRFHKFYSLPETTGGDRTVP